MTTIKKELILICLSVFTIIFGMGFYFLATAVLMKYLGWL